MKSEYEHLAQQIRQCSACSFRDPRIEPLLAPCPSGPVSVMFVGENPSWAGGQDMPFAASTVSGEALDAHYLQPLGLDRSAVWVTDLFKCRYPKHVYREKAKYDKAIQKAAQTCAHHWLVEEIRLVRPQVLVTLSDKQVYQRLHRAFKLPIPEHFSDAVGKPHPINLDGLAVTLFPMIHPDVSRPLGEGDSRKRATREKWAPLHRDSHLPALKHLL